MPPIFTISLDFELNWGVFEKDIIFKNPGYFENTINGIPRKLQLFEKYVIRATWATVGMLFHKDRESWLAAKPQSTPNYKNIKVSSYNWYTDNFKRNVDKYLFAPDLVKKIINTPGQELGTHTYSHYYCLEDYQTIEDFDTDFQLMMKMTQPLNISLSSLVFPRNQFNSDYLGVCWRNGITSVRTNPSVWFWNVNSKWKKLNKVGRIIDSYIYSNRVSHFDIKSLEKKDGEPLKIPASRLLRPHDENKILNKLRVKMIINEMSEAAKVGACYHLWWHPHNFGLNTEENFNDLTVILDHYKDLQNKYGMISMSMGDIYQAYIKG